MEGGILIRGHTSRQKEYTIGGPVKLMSTKTSTAVPLGGEQGAEEDRRARGIMRQGTRLEAVRRGHWHPRPSG